MSTRSLLDQLTVSASMPSLAGRILARPGRRAPQRRRSAPLLQRRDGQ